MNKLLLLSLMLLGSGPKPRYLILVGDISCKSCVIQLHTHFITNLRSRSTVIGLKDRQSVILNEMAMDYYKTELPDANFVLINDTTLFKLDKYPCVLKIQKHDTLLLTYAQLFFGDALNVTILDR